MCCDIHTLRGGGEEEGERKRECKKIQRHEETSNILFHLVKLVLCPQRQWLLKTFGSFQCLLEMLFMLVLHAPSTQTVCCL